MLVLLCHPETQMQAETLWLSTLDSVLSEAGRTEAETLAGYNRVVSERAYVGPADHVREFAKIILHNNFETVEEFADRSMGTLTGRSYRDTLAEFPRRNWLAWQRSYWSAPPEGESLFDISDRVLTAFRTRILPVRSTETVAIICAADVMRILIGYLSRTEEIEVPKIKIEPAVPYTIQGDLNLPA